MTVPIFVAALSIMAVSLIGVVFLSQSLAHILERNLKVLMAFSAGAFIVLTYSLFSEAIEVGISISILALSALAGAMFLEAVDRLVHVRHTHNDNRNGVDAHRILLGDAVHNISDGLVIVPAFLADIHLGIITASTIFFHEFIQEIAEFFVLRAAGYSTVQALTRNLLASSTILVGVVLALFVTSLGDFEAILLAFGGGSFLYVVVRDLIPSVIRSVTDKQHRAGRFLAAAFIGAAAMIGVQVFTPHVHEEAREVGVVGESHAGQNNYE